MIKQLRTISAILLTIFSLCSLIAQDGVECIFNSRPTTNLPSALSSAFEIHSQVIFFEDSMLLENRVYPVIEIKNIHFNTKRQLRDSLNCHVFNFKNFDNDIQGSILDLVVNIEINGFIINSLKYIKFEAFGRTYRFLTINNLFGVEYVNLLYYQTNERDYLTVTHSVIESHDYVLENEITGYLVDIVPLEYNTIQELVLVKESYDSLIISEPQFKDTFILIYQQRSLCQEAKFDTFNYSYIKHEYFEVEILPPVFELVTEQVLETEAYSGPNYYRRKPFIIDSTTNYISLDLKLDSIIDHRLKYDFYNSLNYQIAKDTANNLTNIGIVYPKCDENWQPAGTYCYSNISSIPATYSTRSYTRVKAKSKLIKNNESTIWDTAHMVSINNTLSIPDSCIVSKIDTIPVYKNVNPLNPIYITNSAKYESREYHRIKKQISFTSEKSQEIPKHIEVISEDKISLENGLITVPKIYPICVFNHIRKSLLYRELIDENVTLGSIPFYQAIIEFQKLKKLPIGIIETGLLTELKIFYF